MFTSSGGPTLLDNVSDQENMAPPMVGAKVLKYMQNSVPKSPHH